MTTVSFDDARAKLAEVFGHTEFRPGQERVIQSLLGGHSAAAVFPTGGGKSLCYQLPALLFEGVTVVVSPLIALMKDQIDALAARGVQAARLDSSLTDDEYFAAIEGLKDGSIRLVYAAPERFKNERFRAFVERQRISLFAVDEAHCISEWGHNFRPDYLKLAEFARRAEAERILALTATATPQVLAEMCRGFEIDPTNAVTTGFYRPNLELHARGVKDSKRMQVLLDEIQNGPEGPKIVYVTTHAQAERCAAYLAKCGFDAKAYHAGMKSDVRATIQEWFTRSQDGIVVATIAFGMGIDKANIRAVVHYAHSKGIESYSQEIGRAGRDGELAKCTTLVCSDDERTLENFALGDTPSEPSIRRLVDEVFGPEDRPNTDIQLSLYALSRDTDIRELVARTLLVYLEIDEFIEAGTPIYSTYQFKPIRESSAMLADIEDSAERKLTQRILAQSKPAKVWFRIDVSKAALDLRIPRKRVVSVLDDLASRGDLELQAKGSLQPYRILAEPEDRDALARAYYERMLEREERELERLAGLRDLLLESPCITNALCQHFGEVRKKPCGHCAGCLGGERHVGELRVESKPVTPKDLPDLTELAAAHPEVLGEPRARARFLCGLPSPATAKAKLRQSEHYGALASSPFRDVLAAVESADRDE